MMNGCCFGGKSEVTVYEDDERKVRKISELKKGDSVMMQNDKVSKVLCLIEIIYPEKDRKALT
jgi:hypothetical protein